MQTCEFCHEEIDNGSFANFKLSETQTGIICIHCLMTRSEEIKEFLAKKKTNTNDQDLTKSNK